MFGEWSAHTDSPARLLDNPQDLLCSRDHREQSALSVYQSLLVTYPLLSPNYQATFLFPINVPTAQKGAGALKFPQLNPKTPHKKSSAVFGAKKATHPLPP